MTRVHWILLGLGALAVLAYLVQLVGSAPMNAG
jgi:hypothetical protein